MMKPVHIISTLIGAVAIAAIVWFIGTPRDMDPVVTYKTTRLDTPKTDPTAAAPSQRLDTEHNGAPRDPANHGSTSTDAQRPEGSAEQRLAAAMASPAYLEYSRKQAERVGFNIVLYWEFLEAAGITHNGRILQAEAFDKYFPDGGTYADYEPMMRLAVAEMFLEDPSQSVMDVLQRFNVTQSNRVWRFGYFNGYEGEYEWGQHIRQDAARIVANAHRPQSDEVPSLINSQPTATEMFPIDGGSETGASVTGPPNALPEEMPAFEVIKSSPQTLEELEAQFFKQLDAGIPELPNEAALETSLRERFSSERFNTAVETLHRYGPRDGLRHLKTADPEVAAYFERYLPTQHRNRLMLRHLFSG